jgi:S13-like protein
MTVTTPERSLEQRRYALEKANDIRMRRARLKKDLKARRITIHTLIVDPPEFIETMKLFDLILASPKYGRVKANKMLGYCRISPSKTIGGLSERQRKEIASFLR